MVFDAVAEEERDVDVTVRAVGGDGSTSVFDGLEVKDHTRRLDVIHVEQLCAKLRDMPTIADRGIVSASGYTEAALRKAIVPESASSRDSRGENVHFRPPEISIFLSGIQDAVQILFFDGFRVNKDQGNLRRKIHNS